MDLGLVGFDGFVCSGTSTKTSNDFSSENATEAKNKWHGSGFLKQQRPADTINQDDYRGFKMAKTCNNDAFSAAASKEMLIHQNIPFLRSNSSNFSEGQQMLSFSSPNSQTWPYYQQTSCAFSRNPGLNGAGMHGVRGPITPSQWMELEHQALIYKYITANVPIPSYLLNPIRKALQSAACSTFSGLRPNTLGWGSTFHLGFSNTDPEPGRCRRTDGKKWRCSKDAVADQKYCERHMNRGRHRSRKPVEGQPGRSVSGATTTITGKLTPVASSTTASVVAGGGVSYSFGLSHDHHLNNYQLGSNNSLSAIPHVNRNILDKEHVDKGYQHTMSVSMLSSASNLKENQSFIAEQQNPYKESSQSESRLVCSNSLVNPVNESSLLVNCRNYGMCNNHDYKESKSQHPFRQFMDDWTKNQTEPSAISWADVRTQLSMSMPMVTSDFMSSTSSPTNENLAASSLRMSQELEATQMGLGVGTLVSEQSQRQMNWIPISWDSSGGGPLGEVLNSTNNSTVDSKNVTALDLLKEGRDSSPQSASSPTGVLQTFRSISNSSAGE
ncbi:Growth-regulating factor 1 [Forsythia ovata]|uniref:Growth-regulating factor n=1 Tax=Forsythia ovata TaxID=205694 RepID=A0ABD1RL60_9LAMI